MDFNQANWATITNSYLRSMKKTLSPASKFDIIINTAKTFLKSTSRAGDTKTSPEDRMPVVERALLCDDPDSDSE